MSGHERVEHLLRELAPQVLGALVRSHGQFDANEDAVQEALLAAAVRWPVEGIPTNPRGWLITVASRRLTDLWRSDQARHRREVAVATMTPAHELVAAASDADRPGGDDTLILLYLCCHPALSPASQVALTLRAVGGLTTSQIARAFLVPEANMAQRISRAKQRIRAAGATFALPPEHERGARLRVVLHVLYLIFNEGYTATSGPQLQRRDLSSEAIRLARMLHRLMPDEGEVAGLLALMLLTDARRSARTGPDGSLIPLAEQDRLRWHAGDIEEGVELVTRSMSRSALGPYQLQAAIAALHAEAPSSQETDWPQILVLYRLLARIAPSPMATLSHAVAAAMVDGPQAGLALLATLDTDARMLEHHRLDAVRGHLLELAGDREGARAAYQRAAQRTLSLPEQHYLQTRACRVAADPR